VHLLQSDSVQNGFLLMSNGAGGTDLAVARQSTLDLVEALNTEEDILYAEPNYIYQHARIPGDEFYGLQWHYPYLKLPQAWDLTIGSPNTVIAVIDSGAKFAHPDLKNRLNGGQYDFISDPQRALDGDGIDPSAEDVGDDPEKKKSSFHGTHVAGTIGAEANVFGVVGVNWSSPLMTLRALGAGGGTNYDISQAVLYAAGRSNVSKTTPAKAASVINLSLAGTADSLTLKNAIQSALNQGVTVVAAAGNDNTDEARYPACYPGVICVGAVDLSGSRAPYSNYGPHITVVAPGGNGAVDLNNDGYVDGVLSTAWNETTTDPARQPVYKFYQGTSMAAPQVTGIISLLLARKSTLTPAEIKQIIEQTALDLGPAGFDYQYGHGLIDPVEALKRVIGSSNLPPKLVVSTTAVDFGYSQTQFSVSVSNGGGGTLQVNPPTVVMNKGTGWLAASLSGSNLVISVNRTKLSSGDYTGAVRVSATNGDQASITVLMRVGTATAVGDIGTIYVLTLDPRTFNTVSLSVVDTSVAGRFPFQFPPMFAGSYFLIAGNDADGNGIICETNEYCGLYPVSSQMSLVEVEPNRNTSGINFLIEKKTTTAAAALLEDLKRSAGGEGLRVDHSAVVPRVVLELLGEAR
jgi:serine protease